MGADTAELVGTGEAGNDGIVADFAVAAECAVVGKDDVIADLAVRSVVGLGSGQEDDQALNLK